MSIKKLKYPALDIDNKLTEAHTHSVDGAGIESNIDALNKITEETIKKIDTIDDKLNKDLSNVDGDSFKQASLNAGVAFVDVSEDEGVFGRIKGDWKQIKTVDVNSIVSGDADKSIDIRGNSLGVSLSLSSAYKQRIVDLENSKVKFVGDKIKGNLLVYDDINSINIIPTKYNDILTKANLSKDLTDSSKEIPASAYLTNLLSEKISSISSGIGKNRGVVVNAYVSTTPVFVVSNWTIDENVGRDYLVGDIVTLPGIIDTEFVVKLVDNNGGVAELEIVTQGFNSSDSFTSPLYGGHGTGLSITVNGKTSTATTLNNVDSPIKGDTVYVIYDETHDNNRSLFEYDGKRWNFLMIVAYTSEEFQSLITGDDIASSTITGNNIEKSSLSLDLLKEIGAGTLLGNFENVSFSPQPKTISDFITENKIVTGSVVTGIKFGQEEEEGDNYSVYSGEVTIYPHYLELRNMTIPQSPEDVTPEDNVMTAIAKLQASITALSTKLANVSSRPPIIDATRSGSTYVATSEEVTELYTGLVIMLSVSVVTTATVNLLSINGGEAISIKQIASDGSIVDPLGNFLRTGIYYTLTYSEKGDKKYWIVNSTRPVSSTLVGENYAIVEPLTSDPSSPALGKLWLRTDL